MVSGIAVFLGVVSVRGHGQDEQHHAGHHQAARHRFPSLQQNAKSIIRHVVGVRAAADTNNMITLTAYRSTAAHCVRVRRTVRVAVAAGPWRVAITPRNARDVKNCCVFSGTAYTQNDAPADDAAAVPRHSGVVVRPLLAPALPPRGHPRRRYMRARRNGRMNK